MPTTPGKNKPAADRPEQHRHHGTLNTSIRITLWPATLLQMVTIVGLVMVLTAWVYFNPGWLKRDYQQWVTLRNAKQ